MKRYCKDKIVLAYWNTTYRLVGQGIDVLIAKKNDTFIEFLISHNFHSWAIITAWNPGSEVFPSLSNELFNESLKNELEELSCFYDKALGIPKEGSAWVAEVSFFVADISIDEACVLGKKYNQNAIVYGSHSCLPSLIWLKGI
ncbi:MAG: DUF3293 domain-containing protein [Saprospirales bacterium]|nr:MAG: DUF3293 domain-containing protein [Saprospirales bacterium]